MSEPMICWVTSSDKRFKIKLCLFGLKAERVSSLIFCHLFFLFFSFSVLFKALTKYCTNHRQFRLREGPESLVGEYLEDGEILHLGGEEEKRRLKENQLPGCRKKKVDLKLRWCCNSSVRNLLKSS